MKSPTNDAKWPDSTGLSTCHTRRDSMRGGCFRFRMHPLSAARFNLLPIVPTRTLLPQIRMNH